MNATESWPMRLAFYLALKSLFKHPLSTLSAIFGVAISMQVVGAVLIVDNNTAHTIEQQILLQKQLQERQTGAQPEQPLPVGFDPLSNMLRFERVEVLQKANVTQSSQTQTVAIKSTDEDGINLNGQNLSMKRLPQGRDQSFPAMRMAIRIASLLAFLVGAVIIFHTLRHAVARRQREFALLQCIGVTREQNVLSLLIETGILGVTGTVLGVALALSTAKLLMAMGISTNGLHPLFNFDLPWIELGIMIPLSLVIGFMGAIGPTFRLWRMELSSTLRPIFLAEAEINPSHGWDLTWLLPPLLLASYVVVRPILISWLPIAIFFIIEMVFIVGITILTLWLVRPLLHMMLWIFERILTPMIPLAAFLAGRRMRFSSTNLVFSIAGVALSFALVGGLHVVTQSLETEIKTWSNQAMHPYGYYVRNQPFPDNQSFDSFKRLMKKSGIHFFRMSPRVAGKLPLRLVHAEDVAPFLAEQRIPPLGPGKVILTQILAVRLGAQTGDILRLHLDGKDHLFDIIAITDVVGIQMEHISYLDLKSLAIFSQGNPIFSDNLEPMLGELAMARNKNPDQLSLSLDKRQRNIPKPFYQFTSTGDSFSQWQTLEIAKDFLIFDFILFMTVILACLGVANTLLIQAVEKRRELAVLKSVGLKRTDLMKLVMTEGLMVGLLSASVAALLGQLLGVSAVNFISRSTNFNYIYIFSDKHLIFFFLLTVTVCLISALLPAWSVGRISSSESMHYE